MKKEILPMPNDDGKPSDAGKEKGGKGDQEDKGDKRKRNKGKGKGKEVFDPIRQAGTSSLQEVGSPRDTKVKGVEQRLATLKERKESDYQTDMNKIKPLESQIGQQLG